MFSLYLTNTSTNYLYIGGYDGEIVLNLGATNAETLDWILAYSASNALFNVPITKFCINGTYSSLSTYYAYFEPNSFDILLPKTDFNNFNSILSNYPGCKLIEVPACTPTYNVSNFTRGNKTYYYNSSYSNNGCNNFYGTYPPTYYPVCNCTSIYNENLPNLTFSLGD